MVKHSLIMLVFSTYLCAGVCAAQAQETPKERMHALNEKGFELFAEGQFDDAARSFSQAYKLYPDINLRKNESLAWFKHGDCERARIAGRLFLNAQNISQADKRDARTVFVRCTLTLAKQSLDDNEDYKAQLYLDEASTMYMSPEDKATHKKLSDDIALRRTSGSSGISRSVAGWGLVGAGAVVLTSAMLYHVFINDDEEELITISQKGGDRARYDKLAQRLDTAQVLLPTLYTASILSLAAGGTLLLWPSIEASTQSNAQNPVGATFHVRF